ncbi:MAG: BLUF domain-containing protein [Planctomycetaceae bacterium]|nr:BLUF domain-containing protein [Planctomycetaceae bacterium]
MIQVIYASAATRPFTREELFELLEDSRLKNSQHGLSGMLLYHGGAFLQVIEGEEADVEQLYEKIKRDERHENVRLIARFPIEERCFGDWKMGFYDSTGSALAEIPGFMDIFRHGLPVCEETCDRAVGVLRQFRRGQWHQKPHSVA